MMSSSINDVRSFMLQYSLELDTDTINEGLICIMCNKLMSDAYQSYCGCQYCHGCIVGHLLDGGDKYCVGSKDECKEEHLLLNRNIVVNAMLNNRILKSRVHCPNKPCTIITEVMHMEEHMRECSHQSIECPFSIIGCETDIGRKDRILTHLHDDTLTHSQLLITLIDNLRNEFSDAKEELEMIKLETITLMGKLREKDVQIENLKMEMIERNAAQIENVNIQETEVGCQRRETHALNMKVVILKGKLRKRKMTIEDVKKEVSTLNVGTNTIVAVGIYSHTLYRLSAKKAIKVKIRSPYFYSHTNGYKLRLRLYPGGYNEDTGTHLSVFLNICRGEYDDILPWPCRHTFTIGVVNQRDGLINSSLTHNYANAEEDNKDAFDKPINEDNDGYEIYYFVSHTKLQSEVGLVVDDSVIIQCVVSAPP